MVAKLALRTSESQTSKQNISLFVNNTVESVAVCIYWIHFRINQGEVWVQIHMFD